MKPKKKLRYKKLVRLKTFKKAAQANVRAKKKKKTFELRDDLIPLKGYIGSLVFHTKFNHM